MPEMSSSNVKARIKGRLLRQYYGLNGRVDAQGLADAMGLHVRIWPLPAAEVHEITICGVIGVSADLDDAERRWALAHGIGHRILHPGNAVWARAHTLLGNRLEREAEEFAYGLLVDEGEALAERLPTLAEVADHFGIPMYTLWESASQTWGWLGCGKRSAECR